MSTKFFVCFGSAVQAGLDLCLSASVSWNPALGVRGVPANITADRETNFKKQEGNLVQYDLARLVPTSGVWHQASLFYLFKYSTILEKSFLVTIIPCVK